ncbi:MAG TPA: CPBP family intramembrane glutamic endopeptidase [candidate division Zixibacteria bacterium]|nr:CPBP family intramembrane glutamic endopeptidase [candidate division Zixibacteria bacterium]
MSRAPLVLEFALLFVVLPIAFRLLPMRLSPLPPLWVAAAYCYFVLRSNGYDRNALWNAAPVQSQLPGILAGFAIAAIAVTAFVYWQFPDQLFGFVKSHPVFWMIVMVAYPVLSVYPQAIIYRAFVFERYRSLFPGTCLMIVVSAAVFSFSHIIFRSPWSVVLTFAAGLLFAWRFSATNSLLVSAIEHALYGCYMFTVGLGGLFYHGAGRAFVQR